MTIAVLAKDNADPKTGLEYGTVTSAAWKAKSFFRGPLNRDIANPKVEYTPIPANWFAPDFDDSTWSAATEYDSAEVHLDWRPGTRTASPPVTYRARGAGPATR